MNHDHENHDPALTLYKGTPSLTFSPPAHLHSEHRSATSVLGERLCAIASGDARIEHLAERVTGCASHVWRCKQTALCPRCARRAAIKARRPVAKWLDAQPAGTVITHDVFTANADAIATGADALRDSMARLRRRKSFASVNGGRGQIEVERSAGGSWHVHAHLLVASTKPLDARALDGDWRELLGGRAAGRVHVGAVARRTTHGERFRALRVRDEAGADVAARPEPRRAARVRERGAGQTVGRVVRAVTR